MSTDVLSVRLPAEVKGRLDALSRSTGRSVAYYVREAVVERLDDLEWAYDVARRAEAVRTGARDTVALDDAARSLGLDPDDLRAEARSDADTAP